VVAEAFRVDPQALADAVRRMTAFQHDAEDMIAEIDSRVTHLHTSWTGAGAAAHAEAHQHWVHGEAMMREALAQLEKAATTAHGNYTGAVSTNLGMWS
jgi:WXG100 family type VII secretion target